MADLDCIMCNKPIIHKHGVDGSATAMYLTKECHLSCILKHIFKKHKGPPPDKVGNI